MIAFRKTQRDFRRKGFTISQILTFRRIIKGIHAKNLEVTLLFVDFFMAFDSIQEKWSKHFYLMILPMKLLQP